MNCAEALGIVQRKKTLCLVPAINHSELDFIGLHFLGRLESDVGSEKGQGSFL